MILRVEESDLKSKLFEHSNQIGMQSVGHGAADMLAGIFYIVTAYATALPVMAQHALALAGLAFAAYGIFEAVFAARHRYSAQQLYQDIKELHRTERRSSILAIKGAAGVAKNKFLLYYDEGWDCWFFPNHATSDPAQAEIPRLCRYLSETCDIPCETFELQFVTDRDSKKPSTEHGGELRYYHYRLYQLLAEALPTQWTNERFQVGDRRYRWMSTDEMLADARMREVNGDVIALVRDNIL